MTGRTTFSAPSTPLASSSLHTAQTTPSTPLSAPTGTTQENDFPESDNISLKSSSSRGSSKSSKSSMSSKTFSALLGKKKEKLNPGNTEIIKTINTPAQNTKSDNARDAVTKNNTDNNLSTSETINPPKSSTIDATKVDASMTPITTNQPPQSSSLNDQAVQGQLPFPSSPSSTSSNTSTTSNIQNALVQSQESASQAEKTSSQSIDSVSIARSNSLNNVIQISVSKAKMKRSRSANSLRKMAAHKHAKGNAYSTQSTEDTNGHKKTRNSTSDAKVEPPNTVISLKRQDSKFSICSEMEDHSGSKKHSNKKKEKSSTSKKRPSMSRQSSFRDSIGHFSRQSSFRKSSGNELQNNTKLTHRDTMKKSSKRSATPTVGKDSGIKFERQERRIDWMINKSQLETPPSTNYRVSTSGFNITLPTRKSIHFGSCQVRDTSHFLLKDIKDYAWESSTEEERLKQKRRNSLLSTRSFSSPALLKDLSDIPVTVPSPNDNSSRRKSLSQRKSFGAPKLPQATAEILHAQQMQALEDEKANAMRKARCIPLTKAAKRQKKLVSSKLKQQQEEILLEKSLKFLALVDCNEVILETSGKEEVKRVQRALSSNSLLGLSKNAKSIRKSLRSKFIDTPSKLELQNVQNSELNANGSPKTRDKLHIEIPKRHINQPTLSENSPTSTTSSTTNNAVTVALTSNVSGSVTPTSEGSNASAFSSPSTSPTTPSNRNSERISRIISEEAKTKDKKRRFSMISLESTIIDMLGEKSKKKKTERKLQRSGSFSRAPSRDFSWLVHHDMNPSGPGQYDIEGYYDQLDSTKIQHRIARPVTEQARFSWGEPDGARYHTALKSIPSTFTIEAPTKKSAFGSSKTRIVPDRNIEELWYTEIPPHVKRKQKL